MTMYDEKDWNDDVTILDDDGFSFLYSFECIVQNEQKKTENKNEKNEKNEIFSRFIWSTRGKQSF